MIEYLSALVVAMSKLLKYRPHLPLSYNKPFLGSIKWAETPTINCFPHNDKALSQFSAKSPKPQ